MGGPEDGSEGVRGCVGGWVKGVSECISEGVTDMSIGTLEGGMSQDI